MALIFLFGDTYHYMTIKVVMFQSLSFRVLVCLWVIITSCMLNAENIACNIFFLEYRWLLCPGLSSLPLNLSLSNSPSSIACVEKVRQEQKEGMKGKGVGEGRKESFVFFPSHPPPPHFLHFWLSLKLSHYNSMKNACYASYIRHVPLWSRSEVKMRSFLRISFLWE